MNRTISQIPNDLMLRSENGYFISLDSGKVMPIKEFAEKAIFIGNNKDVLEQLQNMIFGRATISTDMINGQNVNETRVEGARTEVDSAPVVNTTTTSTRMTPVVPVNTTVTPPVSN